MDDNVIALIETDEELDDDDNNDDMQSHYLMTKKTKGSLRTRMMTQMKTLTFTTTQILKRMISYAKALITLL